MNKDKLERIFSQVGLKPVKREKAGDYEIFYGDGFSRPPHLRWQSRNELKPEEFPHGAFVTFWWVGKDEKLFFGRPVFFNVTEFSQAARLKKAREDAMKRLSTIARTDGAAAH